MTVHMPIQGGSDGVKPWCPVKGGDRGACP